MITCSQSFPATAIVSSWSSSPEDVQEAKIAVPFSVKENGLHAGLSGEWHQENCSNMLENGITTED
jgi:hypothetical protein